MIECQGCERLIRCVIALMEHPFDKTVREQAEDLVEEFAQQLKP